MLRHAGREPIQLELDRLPLGIERLQADAQRPLDGNDDPLQRETALVVGLFLFRALDDRRVDERAGFLVFEDELYAVGTDGWRSVAEVGAARYGERGPGASAVLCAELRPGRLGERVRLALRDVRHRGEPRRATK